MKNEYAVNKTNDPWENLKRLRDLKKKTGAVCTPGLLNCDTDPIYYAHNGKIYSVGCYQAAGATELYSGKVYSESKIAVPLTYSPSVYFANRMQKTFKTYYVLTFDHDNSVQLSYDEDLVAADGIEEAVLREQKKGEFVKKHETGWVYNRDSIYDTREEALKALQKHNKDVIEECNEHIAEFQKLLKMVEKVNDTAI